MAQLHWGRGIGLHFNDNHEYYETLGFLAKRNRYVDVYTHDNNRSGAWAGQGKLETHVGANILPRPLRVAFEQSGDARLSVTDYVLNLKNHGFTIESDFSGNRYTYHLYPVSREYVINTLEAEEYLVDFNRGYNW
jgi:hypothetical protein